MQIHELNRSRKTVTETQQVNEIDLVGPASVWNVGKQVAKNPSGIASSTALGAAKQAAIQGSAAKSAAKLAKQGYQVSSGAGQKVSTAQILPLVRSNAAIQQQVKNLTAQWMPQATSLVAANKIKKMGQKPGSVSEAVAQISNPQGTKDPLERQILDALYKQEAQTKAGTTTAGPAQGAMGIAAKAAAPVQPSADDQADVNQTLVEFGKEFQNWADPKLAAGGITMDTVRSDPATAKMLQDQVRRISILSMANPGSKETQAAVEEYFNLAIAGIQMVEKNRSQGVAAAPASGGGATGAAEPSDEELLTQLQSAGLAMTKPQIESLGKVMIQAANGSNVIRNTGNPVLNAIARLAGMSIQQ